MPKVEVLVGMIASGKSTFAKRRAAEGAIIVNDDAIVTALHGGDYGAYQNDLTPLYKHVEEAAFAIAVTLGRDVVIDRGVNVSANARRRWVGLAHAYNAHAVAVVFPRFSPKEHASRRFNSDGRGHSEKYWIEVAKARASRYDAPTEQEGFAAVVNVHEGK